jgi:kynurenine formamidase
MKHASRAAALAAAFAVTAAAAAIAAGEAAAQNAEHRAIVERSKAMVPAPPWPAGDQVGMANTIGAGTWMRCAYHMTRPNAKVYELSHVLTNTMPSSAFSKKLVHDFSPSAMIPGTMHAFNNDGVAGEAGQQGTQFDALGHFGFLDKPWDGKGDRPFNDIKYYSGYMQKDVKPTPNSPLLKLGVENVPPLVTSAVLLDAKAHLGKGQAMKGGQLVTAKDIEDMLKAQGLEWRGLLPGDVLYIYTGWSENWQDPDEKKVYYTQGPGLSYDAAKYLGEKRVVLVALDNPFTDPVSEGQLQGKAKPPEGTPPGLPFVIHHYNLAVAGIHNIQNANLAQMAADKVWTSCTMILPLRTKGSAGSPVRPVAIGAPE